jgi:hypothetical protein
VRTGSDEYDRHWSAAQDRLGASETDGLYQRQKAEVEQRLERTRLIDVVWSVLAGIVAGIGAAYPLFLKGVGGTSAGTTAGIIVYTPHPVFGVIVGVGAFAFMTYAVHRTLRARRAKNYWGL